MENILQTEFKAFGFITAQLRRGFIVTSFCLCLCAITYLVYDNRRLNAELLKTKDEQRMTEQRIYEKMLLYFEPKLNMIDSTATLVQKSVNKQDSVQTNIINRYK